MRYVECIDDGFSIMAGKRYELIGEGATGKWRIFDDDFDECTYDKCKFKEPKTIKVGDLVTIKDDYSFLTKGKTYNVIEIDKDDGVKIEVDDGDYIHFEFNELDGIIHQEGIVCLNDLPKNKNAEANEEKTTMTKVAPKTTATKTNKFTDKFGTFGSIDGVALTMTGTIAVIGMDGNYYSYENDTLVSHDDMVMDGVPGFAMPVLRSTLKAGDIVLDKDKGFLFVDKQKNMVSYDGTVHKTAKQSHAMFGTAFDFVSKVVDMSGMMGGQQGQINPMMMMFMMKDRKGEGNTMDKMMEIMMMSQMMGGQATSGENNLMANPMMLMMMMDGKDNDMIKTMFMFQMMQNQQKAEK